MKIENAKSENSITASYIVSIIMVATVAIVGIVQTSVITMHFVSRSKARR